MPVSAACPTCQARVRIPDDSAGRRFRCPKCQGVIAGVAKTIVSEIVPDFIDAQEQPGDQELDEQPGAISAAARASLREAYNPFDDGSEEEETRKSRFAPKEVWNPFAEPPPAVSGGEAESFDFGVVEPEAPPAGDLDFGPPVDPPKRRRR